MLAVFAIVYTPGGSGLTTVTANVTEPVPSITTSPTENVQPLPALSFGMQAQPAVLAPRLNVVFAGTVSVITTPVAFWLPVFVKLSV
jgi:hypothetical protein